MERKLNKEQQEAVDATDRKIVIIAPPGSGKTVTMISAIDKYIEDNPEDDMVTAITFTKKAASELSQAFFRTDKIHASTIHSWSYTHLNRLGKIWGFRTRLLEEEQILSIIKPFLKLYNLNKKYNLMPVYSYIMGNYNMDLKQSIKNKYQAILENYIKFKRKRKLYDFTDLPLYLYDVLEEYEEEIVVDGLYVDEFQDVDPVQLKVFRKVKAKKYFFIGDPKQAIYQFRGASKEIFEELHDYKVLTIKQNYRSYQEILDYAYTVRDVTLAGFVDSVLPVTESEPAGIEAVKGYGAKILTELAYSKIDFRKKVKKEFMENKYQILCRTNKQVREIKDMGYDNVSTIHKAKGLEFDNVAFVDFPIDGEEDVNVAFVGLTRAKNREVVLSFETLLKILYNLPQQAKTKYQEVVKGF